MSEKLVKVLDVYTRRPRYVVPHRDIVTCGACGRSWDDSIPTSMTPAPSARCPFEDMRGHGARVALRDITITRQHPSGALEARAIVDGYLVRRNYYGYSAKEVRAMFQREV